MKRIDKIAARILFAFCPLLATCMFFTSSAAAHSVYVTAWADGAAMCAEGSFSTKSKAKNSAVVVTDAKGAALHEGRTDANGVVCFPLPEKPVELTFTLNAGQGHVAKTILYEDDFPSDTERAQTAPPITDTSPDASPKATPNAAPSTAPNAALEAVVRNAVSRELQQQLGPIRQSLSALQIKKPGMLEIFGGIGWIVGLAGAAALAASRRKDK
ncbi:MAG: hypothetical protein DELT_02643 [Desulfovibrio sp.]